jgi:hypothetical protein
VTSGLIQTHSGALVAPMNPDPATLTLPDIAHALSHICRFTGHTRTFYSVAEHSVRVARLVPPEDRLAALLHDATEAYLCDIATPVKAMLPGYAEAEDRLARVVAHKWGVAYPWPESVKAADRVLLHSEAKVLMGDPEWARGHETVEMRMVGWEPWYARLEFMEMFTHATR